MKKFKDVYNPYHLINEDMTLIKCQPHDLSYMNL